MKIIVERLFLQIKEMKLLFLIPFLGYYILLPVCTYGYVMNPIGKADPFTIFADLGYNFIPVFSTWWIFLCLREVCESDGREVLLLGGGTTEVNLCLFVLNMLSMLPIFFVFKDTDGSVMSFYLQMLVITFFLSGGVYLLCFEMKNITLPFLITLIYCVFSTSSNEFLDFMKYSVLNNIDWMQNAMGFIVVGSLFWLLANRRSKHL